MIAIVVGRCETLSAAQKLAARFEHRHGVNYRVEKIARTDFERRPFAVILECGDECDMTLASLEHYEVSNGRFYAPGKGPH